MALMLGPILRDAGIDPSEAVVIRHAYVNEHWDGFRGLPAESIDAEVLDYTGGGFGPCFLLSVPCVLPPTRPGAMEP